MQLKIAGKNTNYSVEISENAPSYYFKLLP